MRRVSILLVALWAVLTLGAQEPEEAISFVFEQTEWNFGRINESDGAISHSFRFRNEADHSVAIERVYVSCGCTSTDYSRRPIRAGQESEFVVTFDPEGRSGRVDRVVTIVYDGGKGTTDLHIKGRVKARPLSVEETHPYELGGGVRCDGLYRDFGRVAQKRTKSMTLALVNTSSEVVEIGVQWESRSGMLEIEVPTMLASGASALATLTYRPSALEDVCGGPVEDEFRLLIDGAPSGELFRTSAEVDVQK